MWQSSNFLVHIFISLWKQELNPVIRNQDCRTEFLDFFLKYKDVRGLFHPLSDHHIFHIFLNIRMSLYFLINNWKQNSRRIKVSRDLYVLTINSLRVDTFWAVKQAHKQKLRLKKNLTRFFLILIYMFNLNFCQKSNLPLLSGSNYPPDL